MCVCVLGRWGRGSWIFAGHGPFHDATGKEAGALGRNDVVHDAITACAFAEESDAVLVPACGMRNMCVCVGALVCSYVCECVSERVSECVCVCG